MSYFHVIFVVKTILLCNRVLKVYIYTYIIEYDKRFLVNLCNSFVPVPFPFPFCSHPVPFSFNYRLISFLFHFLPVPLTFRYRSISVSFLFPFPFLFYFEKITIKFYCSSVRFPLHFLSVSVLVRSVPVRPSSVQFGSRSFQFRFRTDFVPFPFHYRFIFFLFHFFFVPVSFFLPFPFLCNFYFENNYNLIQLQLVLFKFSKYSIIENQKPFGGF